MDKHLCLPLSEYHGTYVRSVAGIVDLIFNLNRTVGNTLVLVTHDLELAKRTNRILKLNGGEIESVLETGMA